MSEFDSLKVGDNVIVEKRSYRHCSDYYLAHVDRVTKTLVIVDGLKYKKDGGHLFQKRTSFHTTFANRIHIVSAEMMVRVKNTEIRNKAIRISSMKWQELANEKPEIVEAVFEMINNL